MADDKQVSDSAFLRSLNKTKAAAKAAAKEKRGDGIPDDSEIAARLGLAFPNNAGQGDSITLSAKVSVIQQGFAKQDTNRPYFRFAYVISEDAPTTGKGKGTMLSNYHELTEGKNKEGEVYRTIEDAFRNCMFEFQGVGEETDAWDDPVKSALACAKKHTKEKTPVRVQVSTYKSQRGSTGISVRVSPDDSAKDNSDLGEDSDDAEFNADDWVDGWVTYDGTDFKVSSYDEDADTFTGEDEDGEEVVAPSSECEWAEDQRED